RRVGDRVHQDVEAIRPVPGERIEQRGDLGVVGHVERIRRAAAEPGGDILHARLQFFVLVAEGELGALPMHRLGDAVGDRALAGDAGDECALALQETHGRLAIWTGRYSATAVAPTPAAASIASTIPGCSTLRE